MTSLQLPTVEDYFGPNPARPVEEPAPVPDGTPEPPRETAADIDDRLLAHELRSQRARRRARDILNAEQLGAMPAFDIGSLADVLARPRPPASRVEQLIPWEASTLLTAQRKAGKTTLSLNLARSLIDGSDFLGRFGVRSLDGDVALLNFEVSAGQLARWAADVGVPADRLHLVNLRGRRNPLAVDSDRAELAALLRARGVELVICDPFGRAYTGTSQNDAGEVTSWLAELERFVRGGVGAVDLVLTAHAGWNGERTRGSTALEDWADSIITVTRDDTDDGHGERYLRAIGRDVDLDEDQLHYEPDTRTLTLAGSGSRTTTRAGRRADQLRDAILRIVASRPGVNGAEVEQQLRVDGVSFQRGQERKALAELVIAGQLIRTDGPRTAKLYSLASASPTLPDPPRGEAGETPQTLPIRGGLPEGGSKPEPPQLCSICGGPMTVVEAGQTTHPNCETAGLGSG